jgi:glycosyltransferase involved in cell wall biosynthesis
MIGALADDAGAALLRGCPPERVVTWEQVTDLSAFGRRFLRERVGGRDVVLYLANESAAPLLNHIVLLAAAFGPRRLEIVRHADGSRRRVRLHHVAGALWSLVAATVVSTWSLVRFLVAAESRRRQLQREGPGAGPSGGLPLAQRDVLYVKTNFTFSGVEIGGATAHTLGVLNGVAGLARRTVCLAVAPLAQADPAVHQVIVPGPRSAPLLPSWYGLALSRSLSAAPPGLVADGAMVYQRLMPFCAPGLLFARRYNGTFTVEYNGSEAWVARKWGKGGALLAVMAYFERAALLAADRVVVVSAVLVDELRALGVAEHRIRVHPNGVDPGMCDSARVTAGEIADVRSSLDMAPDALVVTFVGTFGKWHGAEILADAVAAWAREDPDGLARRRAVFVFAGDGLMLPEVKRRLSADTTSRFVRFPGMLRHGRVLHLLAASDILVSPHVPNADGSRFFGSPTKLFEYMAMARAIVASDLEQIGDILAPGARVERLREDGGESETAHAVAILCRPGSAGDIRTALEFLADRPAVRRALGRNARDRVLTTFTWAHHVKAILAPSSPATAAIETARTAPPSGQTFEVQG